MSGSLIYTRYHGGSGAVVSLISEEFKTLCKAYHKVKDTWRGDVPHPAPVPDPMPLWGSFPTVTHTFTQSTGYITLCSRTPAADPANICVVGVEVGGRLSYGSS